MPAGDMDPEYSIGVANRFIGIDNDMNEDPLELIRAAQEKPKKDKDVKTKGSKNAKPPARSSKEKVIKTEPAPQSPVETNNNNTRDGDRPRGRGRGRGRGGERGRGRGGGRGGFNYNNSEGDNQQPRGPRGACHRCGEEGHFVRNCPQPKSPAAPTGDSDFGAPSSGGFGAPSGGFGAPEGGFGAPSSGGFGGGFGNDDEDKRGGRGGFRGRGGRGRGRGGRGGSREFDRRSGSDKSSVKAFDKRDGSGSYNWGTPQDELDASEEQPQGFGAPKEDEPVAESGESTEDGAASGEETENKENAEPEQISFEEWKKRETENRSKTQYNIRKPNEGEKIKGVKQLKKPTEEEVEEDGSLFFPPKIIEEKYKTSGRVKEHLNLQFQYGSGDNRHMDTSRRGGRGRGGGRGGRGGGNRGRGDPMGGGFGSSKHIQLENAEEFPSL